MNNNEKNTPKRIDLNVEPYIIKFSKVEETQDSLETILSTFKTISTKFEDAISPALKELQINIEEITKKSNMSEIVPTLISDYVTNNLSCVLSDFSKNVTSYFSYISKQWTESLKLDYTEPITNDDNYSKETTHNIKFTEEQENYLDSCKINLDDYSTTTQDKSRKFKKSDIIALVSLLLTLLSFIYGVFSNIEESKQQKEISQQIEKINDSLQDVGEMNQHMEKIEELLSTISEQMN